MANPQAMLTKAKEMYAAKYGFADIMAHLREHFGASREEIEKAVADMLRGK